MAKVTLDLKTNVNSLRNIVGVYPNVSVNITWMRLIQQNRTGSLDPRRYSIKTRSGQRHSLLESIGDFIQKEFKTVRKEYSVLLVENTALRPGPPLTSSSSSTPAQTTSAPAAAARRPGVGHGPGPASRTRRQPLASAPYSVPSSNNRGANANTNTARPSSSSNTNTRREAGIPLPPPTVHLPGSMSSRGQGQGSASTSTGRANVARPAQPQSQPPRRFEEDREGFPNRQNVHPMSFDSLFDDDDAASQLSQLSQSSQINLQEQGVAMEDVKAQFISKLTNNMKNTRLLLIRNEVRKMVEKGNMSRISNVSPHVASFLLEFIHIL